MTAQHIHKKYLLALLVPLLMNQMAYANEEDGEEEPNTDLGTLQVMGVQTSRQGTLGEQVVTQQTLAQENIQSSHDLVRYNAEVDVAEVGRYGNKGFAVRGVDGNRVAMNIDGVSLPEAEANEIFAPYGYMYEGRFNPDVEMMSSVRVMAGADSLLSGSGAVGGSVSYRTKEPNQLIYNEGNLGGYAKVGYASKNEERLSALGLAGVYDRFEFLLNYAHREGSETKNHAMRSADSARLSPEYIFSIEEMPVESDSTSLIYPNPLEFERQSALAKLYYHINDVHRVGIHGLYQKQENHMNTDSANTTTGSRTGSTTRRAHDIEEMEAYGASYRYQPTQSAWLNEAALSYNQNDILGLADTWVYRRTFGCSLPNVSSYLCDYYGGMEVLQSSILQNQEYRPTRTKSNQYSLALQTMPFELGRFGEHQVMLTGSHNQQERTNSATYINASDSSSNFLSFAFADAKKSNYNITLTDDIRFSERLKAMLGVRYDDYEYQPFFESDVNGLNEDDNNKNMCINNNAQSEFCELYRAGSGMPDTEFNHMTYSGMMEFGIVPDRLTARYKIGTGFLAPTMTQIYSNFQGLGVMQVPNYHLKPETSLNQELEFEWKPNENTRLMAAGYVSEYDDFIHTKYWEGNTNGCNGRAICLQSVNLDSAKIKGLKLGVEADLSNKLNLKGQFKVSANYHTSSDSATIQTDNNGALEINTLASVPKSFILGADYISPNQDWSLHGRLRVIGRKKAEDTKSLETRAIESVTTQTCPADIAAWGYCSLMGYTVQDASGNWTRTTTAITGYEEYVDTYEHINQSKTAVVYDLYGSKKFGKEGNVILNAGVYNITDEKYIPWETLRMFNTVSANQMIDSQGYGFGRYTAPGRNYAISLTYEF